jgi:hypothetical protein
MIAHIVCTEIGIKSHLIMPLKISRSIIGLHFCSVKTPFYFGRKMIDSRNSWTLTFIYLQKWSPQFSCAKLYQYIYYKDTPSTCKSILTCIPVKYTGTVKSFFPFNVTVFFSRKIWKSNQSFQVK